MLLRPDLFNENKKGKFSNSLSSNDSILLIKDGFTAESPISDAVNLVNRFLDYKGFVPANKKSINNNFPNSGCEDANFESSFFVRSNYQDLSALPKSSSRPAKKMELYDLSFQGREDSSGIVFNDEQFHKAISTHGIGFLSKREFDA